MLVLSRKVNEEIVIGDDIRVRLVKIGGGRVRLGITAPPNLNVRRAELPKKEDIRELGRSGTEGCQQAVPAVG
ncbi:MAG: carbon storage regulator [Rhodopirellula sp.]|nr:carbon storage regulator [Rhodopirellula sp.]